jgi:hypothetical protein
MHERLIFKNKIMEQTRFDKTIDIISNMLDNSYNSDDSDNDETRFLVNQGIWCLQNGYLLVEFPDVQKFMDEDWFEEEAIFCGGSDKIMSLCTVLSDVIFHTQI